MDPTNNGMEPESAPADQKIFPHASHGTPNPPHSARPPLAKSNPEDVHVPPSPTSLDTLQISAQRDLEREEQQHRFDNPEPHHAWLHSGWADRRRKIFSSLQRTGQTQNRIKRFTDCGEAAWVYEKISSPGEFRICATHCGDRLCVPCGNLRAFWLRKALTSKIESLSQPPLFITLTLAGRPDEALGDKITRLYKGFRDLKRLSIWKDAIKGGVALLEIKYSTKAGRWHPHMHILAEGKYVSQGALSDAWRAVTGDSFIVDVRRANDQVKAINYVTKYVTKPMDSSFENDPELLDQAVMALKKRRLCATFGTWYGIKLKGVDDEELQEDPVDDTTWASVGSLASVISRANAGEPAAIDVLRQLRRCGAVKRDEPHRPSS